MSPGRAKYIRPKHRRRQEVAEYTDLDTQYHYVEVEQNETSVYDEIGDVTTGNIHWTTDCIYVMCAMAMVKWKCTL